MYTESTHEQETSAANIPRLVYVPHSCYSRRSIDICPPPTQVISELATHALGNLPAVFILDNVHLMDKMSWKLLIQVTERALMSYQSVLVLLFRPWCP